MAAWLLATLFAAFFLGFAVGVAVSRMRWFKRGWESSSANQVDLARTKSIDSD